MLTSLDVKNFQSLKDVHLDLGLLTVVVGASNSGKSASVRALKALASNVRGSSCITQGLKAASVTAESDEFKVTLEKTESSSSYRVSVPGEQDKEYTKLAGETPEDVSILLGLTPLKDGLSINFAGQHDSPFLLTTPGASVARILGDLTHVITVFEAVREANRRRTSASGDLKLRTKDLEHLEEQLQSIDSLKARSVCLKNADIALKEAKEIEEVMKSLASVVTSMIAYSDVSIPTQVPDLEKLLIQHSEVKNLHKLITETVSETKTVQEMNEECQYQETLSGNLDSQLHELLEQLGMCPLCERTFQAQ